ncbi:ATP-binding protein [Methyloversatilis sp.]|uniref:ATP-binding protein n=1 Tax=Methyloversatilis sp. TaxID=2569862 RepID=UPI0027B883AF|nr:ATP-binding protein [Methyloversatilis sp.]
MSTGGKVRKRIAADGVVCSQHGPVSRRQIAPGVLLGCGACIEAAYVEQAAFEAHAVVEGRYLDAGLPLGFFGVGFDNFECRVPEQHAALGDVRRFVGRYPAGGNLVLAGPAIGKTHLLVASLKHLAARGSMVRYMNAIDMIHQLSVAGVRDEASESQVMRSLVGPTLLAIDHVGDVPWSEYRRRQFIRVIDARSSHGLPTSIATHTNVAQLRRDIGERSLRRLLAYGDELVTFDQEIHRFAGPLRGTAEFDQYLNPSKE